MAAALGGDKVLGIALTFAGSLVIVFFEPEPGAGGGGGTPAVPDLADADGDEKGVGIFLVGNGIYYIQVAHSHNTRTHTKQLFHVYP